MHLLGTGCRGNVSAVPQPWPMTSVFHFVCRPLLDGDAVLDGGAAAGSWLTVTDLQPYTNYSFWIRGCNTQGCVESLRVGATTPPAGNSRPSIATVKPTSPTEAFSRSAEDTSTFFIFTYKQTVLMKRQEQENLERRSQNH